MASWEERMADAAYASRVQQNPKSDARRKSDGIIKNQVLSMVDIPMPKHGGTFYYCSWLRYQKNKSGGMAMHSCADGSRCGVAVPARFRTLAAYRRHYRKAHG